MVTSRSRVALLTPLFILALAATPLLAINAKTTMFVKHIDIPYPDSPPTVRTNLDIADWDQMEGGPGTTQFVIISWKGPLPQGAPGPTTGVLTDANTGPQSGNVVRVNGVQFWLDEKTKKIKAFNGATPPPLGGGALGGSGLHFRLLFVIGPHVP
jgi:hypothetical protein